MTLYLVLPAAAPKNVDGVTAAIVEADDTATAIEMMATRRTASGGTWTGASATAIATAAVDYAGWKLRIRVSTAAGVTLIEETYTGIAADTINDLGDGIVALLAAHAELTSTYATPLITIATVGDAIGDHFVDWSLTQPNGGGSVTNLLGAIVDDGIAAAVLTAAITVPTDDPNIQEVLTQR